jgi:hypothetical protein
VELPKTPQQADQKAPVIRIPEGVSEFYANSLNVLITPWDFILLYGSTALPNSIATGRGAVAGGARMQSEIRIDAAVRMSPQHAKASANALQRTVAEYEKMFGSIPLPPEEGISEDR